MPLLFSYGTLQQEAVQKANFGHLLAGTKDVLHGYAIDELKITDVRVLKESGKAIHPILRFTGDHADQVQGSVFVVSNAELAQADYYEVDDYVRISTTLQSGRDCWVYVAANTR